MAIPTNLRFLIVDDWSTIRHVVRGLLKEMGVSHVEEAESGAVALSMLWAARYDFVILDVEMPNMNGLELLKVIKADETLKHLPVLMVTSQMNFLDKRFAIEHGAADYILKPFTRATLEDEIAKILAKQVPTV